MKKIVVLFVSIFIFAFTTIGQNVGVNTSTPQAALDVNGDIVIRPGNLAVADGITLDLDVNSARFSFYRVEGPTANFTIAGIAAGVDGRQLSLFNRSGFAMQLNNEDASAAATDMIVTGTNADIIIPNKGIVNLQYDANEGKWIVKSSSKDAVGSGTSFWDTDGTNIYNNNTGNVGIGTNTPLAKLSIKTPINSTGWTHTGGADSIIVSEGIGGVSAAIGTITAHAFRLNTNSTGRMSIYPAGEIVVGPNASGSFGKFTVVTPNNSYGISHISDQGNILATNIGGTSAGIGTFSNTNMRIFCNSSSRIFVAAATGNVGIGTDNPTFKLSVLGSIRATEIRVNTGWSDYVFDKQYKLKSLEEVELFIKKNKHLPDIPSASKLKKEGVDISKIQTKMMAKIEELTLYLIEANKTIGKLKQRVDDLEKRNK